jgi:hypothetical protein
VHNCGVRRSRKPWLGVVAGTVALAMTMAAVGALAMVVGTPGTAVGTGASALALGASGLQSDVLDGSLRATSALLYRGAVTFQARYLGGGSNGYARYVKRVDWSTGSDVFYSAEFFLPRTYQAALEGSTDIMRWDNYGIYQAGADYGGIEVWHDGRARLMLGKYRNDPGFVLAGPIALPEGRWFRLLVHQRLSDQPGRALSEVFLDGRLVARSRQLNSFGHPVDRVRFGIVSIAEGAQVKPLTLYLGAVSVT